MLSAIEDFLAAEVAGLVLHAEVELDVSKVNWTKTKISMNDRLYVHEKAKRTKWWRLAAARAGRGVEQVEWARVMVFFRFPTNHRREVNNLMPTSKAIVDGLVDAGIFPDDNDKFLVGPDNRREPINGSHRVLVRIYCAKSAL